MTSELAKQLKDAGFPQKPRDIENMDSFVFVGQISKSEFEKTERGELGKLADVRIPTLSGLISACGDQFRALKNNVDEWIAYGDEDIKPQLCIQGCKTPEEAVARLWLELNKKQ